jgi:hypothetical protein
MEKQAGRLIVLLDDSYPEGVSECISQHKNYPLLVLG